MECRFIEAETQTTELNVSKVQCVAALIAVREVEAVFSVGLKGAEFGFRSSRRAERKACVLAPGLCINA